MMIRRTIARHAFQGALRCERGVAAVEFAMITPVFVILAIATVDLGMGFYRKMQVQNAAEAGVTYATYRGFQSASVAQAITSATTYRVQATPIPAQFCGCPTATGVAEINCATLCVGNVPPGTYVRASARADYVPLFRYPVLPNPVTFQATAIVRLR